MGGNRVRSIAVMKLQHPSTQWDLGALYLQEAIMVSRPQAPRHAFAALGFHSRYQNRSKPHPRCQKRHAGTSFWAFCGVYI